MLSVAWRAFQAPTLPSELPFPGPPHPVCPRSHLSLMLERELCSGLTPAACGQIKGIPSPTCALCFLGGNGKLHGRSCLWPAESTTCMALSKVQRGVDISGARLRRMRVLGQTVEELLTPTPQQPSSAAGFLWRPGQQLGSEACRFLGQLLPTPLAGSAVPPQAVLTAVFSTAQSFTDNGGSLRIYSGSAGQESACNAKDLGSNPGLGRFPWRSEKSTHSSILAWRIPRTV